MHGWGGGAGGERYAAAAGANGLNVTLDAQPVTDIKALIPAIEQYAESAGVQKPAASAK